MYWCRHYTLEAAYAALYAVRECHPKLASVRAATLDLLLGERAAVPIVVVFPRLPGDPKVRDSLIKGRRGACLDLTTRLKGGLVVEWRRAD